MVGYADARRPRWSLGSGMRYAAARRQGALRPGADAVDGCGDVAVITGRQESNVLSATVAANGLAFFPTARVSPGAVRT